MITIELTYGDFRIDYGDICLTILYTSDFCIYITIYYNE